MFGLGDEKWGLEEESEGACFCLLPLHKVSSIGSYWNQEREMVENGVRETIKWNLIPGNNPTTRSYSKKGIGLIHVRCLQ